MTAEAPIKTSFVDRHIRHSVRLHDPSPRLRVVGVETITTLGPTATPLPMLTTPHAFTYIACEMRAVTQFESTWTGKDLCASIDDGSSPGLPFRTRQIHRRVDLSAISQNSRSGVHRPDSPAIAAVGPEGDIWQAFSIRFANLFTSPWSTLSTSSSVIRDGTERFAILATASSAYGQSPQNTRLGLAGLSG